ncbi:MAG: hypothetical protein O8C65_03540 [Candidatus Methanoperedens sp.]|nr:hypothetical protein [Candidatus Methanoperedens sp.]
MNYIPMIILVIMLAILPLPSLAIDTGYARIVYNVRGLQDYDLHWNDRFPPGSILKIYAEANGVNHRREVGVDYVFIIRDSNNNIVDTAAYSDRYEDYRENDFITYSREVPTSWEDGIYTAEIHIFDLLNDSIMDQYYSDVTFSYLNGSSKPDIPYLDRSDITNESGLLNTQEISINKNFYIDRYASKYPVDRFKVENIVLDRRSVFPNEPVLVSADVTNTFYEAGTTSLSLLLDGKLIDNTTIEIGAYQSQPVSFTVSSETVGNHSLEIIPTGNNTVGLELSTVFNVSAEKKIEIPTAFDFKDIQIDHLSVPPNQTVTISVTVENTGKDGSQPVDIFINDALQEEREVYLNFSEIEDIKFTVTRSDLGAYRVTIGNSALSKVFFVEAATTAPTVTAVPEIEKKPQLKPIIGLSIVIIFILALRLYLKKRSK